MLKADDLQRELGDLSIFITMRLSLFSMNVICIVSLKPQTTKDMKLWTWNSGSTENRHATIVKKKCSFYPNLKVMDSR